MEEEISRALENAREEESYVENAYSNIVAEHSNVSDVDPELDKHLESNDSVTMEVNGILWDNMN